MSNDITAKDPAVSGKIRAALANADQPLSTNQLADRTGYDWHTVRDRLEELDDTGQVHSSELSTRLTLWSNQKTADINGENQ
jgi:chromosome segregation and condensation protein ScpB